MENVHISTDKILETRRLIFRYPITQDAPEVFRVVQSPEFPEQLPLKEIDTLNKIEGWFKRLQELWEEGRVFSWITEERNSRQLVGQVTLSEMEESGVWALAFWTHTEHWGNGYASEAAARLLEFGFEELGAKKIRAAAGEWNNGSNRVMEKIGMQFLGINTQGYTLKDKLIPTREYEISLELWRKRS